MGRISLSTQSGKAIATALTSFNLVQSTPHLAVIELLRPFRDRLEHERIGINVLIDAEDVEYNTRSRSIVTGSDNHAVTDDHKQLSFVVVGEGRERVDRLAK